LTTVFWLRIWPIEAVTPLGAERTVRPSSQT
jgi:hypothetical protein